MNVTRITARIAASIVGAALVPPTEIQLWNAGANPTDYGVHTWNARSIAEVLARYNERGNPILIDVEHNGAVLKDGEPAPTGGYARLEVRSGAPWLVFDWSAYAKAQIESGQRRFLSPEYDVDKNTGEILALYRVSLVADPGTHRARMLATASNGEPMDLQVILAALRAALAAEDPAVAKESITNLLAELEKSSGGDTAPAADPAGDGATDPAPMTTASDDDADADKPKTDDDDKDKDKMAASAKKPAATVNVAVTGADAVSIAAGAAVKQIQAAQRDHLIATQGDRLEPSIRRWASSQPLAVVKGLLDATPAKDGAKTRSKATRGDGSVNGLTERQLQKCKAKGVDPEKYAANLKAMVGG